MAVKTQKKICDVCNGSGQVSFFQGVSRFLLTTEECAECAGTGYCLEPENRRAGQEDAAGEKNSRDA